MRMIRWMSAHTRLNRTRNDAPREKAGKTRRGKDTGSKTHIV